MPTSPPASPPFGTTDAWTQYMLHTWTHARTEAKRRRLRIRPAPDLCGNDPNHPRRTEGGRPILYFIVEEPWDGACVEVSFNGEGLTCSCNPKTFCCPHIVAVADSFAEHEERDATFLAEQLPLFADAMFSQAGPTWHYEVSEPTDVSHT